MIKGFLKIPAQFSSFITIYRSFKQSITMLPSMQLSTKKKMNNEVFVYYVQMKNVKLIGDVPNQEMHFYLKNFLEFTQKGI